REKCPRQEQQAGRDDREYAQRRVLRGLDERRAARATADRRRGAAVDGERQRHHERAGADLGNHCEPLESVRISSLIPAWLVSCGALYSSECFAMMCVARK